MSTPIRNSALFLLLAYSLALIIGTLSPFNFTCDNKTLAKRAYPPEWIPFTYRCPVCGLDLKDKALNVGMFIPFGFLLCLGYRSRRSSIVAVALTAGASCFFSSAIETAQYFLPSRMASASDLLMNTNGGLIGAVIGIFALGFAESSNNILRPIPDGPSSGGVVK
jgi:glycopeptide antibiotics resistance protein